MLVLARVVACVVAVVAVCVPSASGVTRRAVGQALSPTYEYDVGRFATADVSPADVVRDRAGNWYVLDDGLACVKVYAPNGVTLLRTLFTCGGIGDDDTHISRARGIGFDSTSGDLWIADTSNNRVLKVDSLGRVLVSTTLSSSPGGATQFPGDVAVDNSGNAYVVDLKNRVVKVASDGTVLGQWGSLGSGPGQLSTPMMITFSTAGAPTGVLYVSDARNFRIDEFTVGGVFVRSFGSKGTADGQLTMDVRGVAVDSTGTVYAADVGGNRIVRWASNGTALPSLGAGLPYNLSGPLNLFYGARGLYVAGNTLAVCDMFNYRVLLWSLSGSYQGQIAGNPPPPDGHLTPQGVALDRSGRVYVSDYWHQFIEVFNAADGSFVARWGLGRGAALGTLNFADGLAVDDTRDYLYIANRESHVVDRWSLANGSPLARFKLPFSLVRNAWPRAVAVNESSGRFYVADDTNNQVDILGSDGTLLGTITTYGPGASRLGSTQAVAVDQASGDVYVGDVPHQLIDVYDANGNWLRSFTPVDKPRGLAIKNGIVYMLSFRVSEYRLDGSLLIAWGKVGTADNQLNQPLGSGIDADAGDNVFVADSGNHRVKVLRPPPPG